jgi:hypothetical protein
VVQQPKQKIGQQDHLAGHDRVVVASTLASSVSRTVWMAAVAWVARPRIASVFAAACPATCVAAVATPPVVDDRRWQAAVDGLSTDLVMVSRVHRGP